MHHKQKSTQNEPYPKGKSRISNISKEYPGENLCDLSLSKDLLRKIPNACSIKNGKLDFIRMKTYSSSNNRDKIHMTNWEKILGNHIPGQRLLPEHTRNYQNSTVTKQQPNF